MFQKKSIVDHLGNEYPSLKECAYAHGIDYQIFYYRIKQNWPIEKVFAPVRKQEVVYEGKRYRSLRRLCEIMGMKVNTVYRRIHTNGYSVKQALTAKLTKPETYVIRGKKYKSIAEIARVFNLPYDTTVTRIYRGWDLERVISQPVKRKKTNAKELH